MHRDSTPETPDRGLSTEDLAQPRETDVASDTASRPPVFPGESDERVGAGDEPEPRAADTLTVDLGVPVVAVLGNHDHHDGHPDEVTANLREGGAHVLEGEATLVSHGGLRIGVAGTKGFGGGFVGRCAGEFGEPVMKEFVRYSRHRADGLRAALEELHRYECDARIALTHFAPVADTLAGEPMEISPFLGSYLFAEAIDTAGADLAVHGHAHAGTEHGMTGGGVKVRNVAQSVIGRAFHIYSLDSRQPGEAPSAGDTRSSPTAQTGEQ